jgi:hypothetical protein
MLTYLAHSILNYPAQVSDRDKDAGSVQKSDKLLPRQLRSRSRRLRIESAMPDACYSDEEHEDQNLQDQSTENDVLAPLEASCIVGADKQTSATSLYEETENITSDEDLGDPFRANDGVRGGVGAEN